jgi:hypothetical protein
MSNQTGFHMPTATRIAAACYNVIGKTWSIVDPTQTQRLMENHMVKSAIPTALVVLTMCLIVPGATAQTTSNHSTNRRPTLEKDRWRQNQTATVDRALKRAPTNTGKNTSVSGVKTPGNAHSFRRQVTRNTISREPTPMRRSAGASITTEGENTMPASRVGAGYVHHRPNRRQSISAIDYYNTAGGRFIAAQNANGTVDLLNPRTGYWNYGFNTQNGQDLYNPLTGSWNLGFRNADGTHDYLNTRTGQWTLTVPKPTNSYASE